MLDHREIVAVRVAPRDPDRAGEHEIDTRAGLPRPNNALAVGEAPRRSEAAHARDLFRGKHGEHLRVPCLARGRKRRSHRSTMESTVAMRRSGSGKRTILIPLTKPLGSRP